MEEDQSVYLSTTSECSASSNRDGLTWLVRATPGLFIQHPTLLEILLFGSQTDPTYIIHRGRYRTSWPSLCGVLILARLYLLLLIILNYRRRGRHFTVRRSVQ